MTPTSAARPPNARSRAIRLVSACLGLLLLAGCASAPGPLLPPGQYPSLSLCQAYYDDLQRQVTQPDPLYYPVPGASYLRSSRFWSAVDPSTLGAPEQLAWLRGANAMAREALALELESVDEGRLARCGEQLVAALAAQPARVSTLKPLAAPDPVYQTWQRWLGLYPLVRLPVRAGVVREWRAGRKLQAAYRQLDPLAAGWSLFQLAPQAAPALNARWPLAADLGRLLLRWAPSFAIDAREGWNQPGRVARAAGRLAFQAQSPAPLYAYVSYGWYRGQPSVRLNYQLWFAERPARAPWDMLSGRLDALHWRVHLDAQLAPIAFDSMHSCGCWYQLYPAQGYQAQARQSFWQEPVFVGQPLAPEPGQLLLVQAGSHSLLGVQAVPAAARGRPLQLVPVAPGLAGLSAELNPLARGYRGIFDAQGLVPESARLERWLLWPMAIPSAGAMRAPGRHAIAFSGRRLFDDPWLLEALGVAPRADHVR